MSIPTYQEALQQDGILPRSLGDQIASAQRDRIRRTMDKFVRHLLQSQIEAGISEMVFALVPSDCDPLQDTNLESSSDVIEKARPVQRNGFAQEPTTEIVSFEDSDYVRVVRLHGSENTIHFWRQSSVIKALKAEVRLTLGLSEEPLPVLPPAPLKNVKDMTKAERREYEQKISIGTLGNGIGWSSASKTLNPGEIDVRVVMDDLAVRRLTEIGLYETKTGKAIVIRVLVGS